MKRTHGLILVAGCLALSGCDSSRVVERSQQKTAINSEATRSSRTQSLQDSMQRADILYQTADYADSAKAYQQVVALDPKNLKAHYRLGNIAFRMQNWKKARQQYEKVIAIEPRHTRAQHNLAMTYLTLAERHLKFYAANVDVNTNLDSVARLITALEEVSNPRGRKSNSSSSSSQGSEGTPLDKMLETLAQ